MIIDQATVQNLGLWFGGSVCPARCCLNHIKNPSFDGSMSSIPPVLVLIPLIFDG